MEKEREHWNSRLGFILATVGSAVGLGNIWRFPTMVVQGGGGIFVLLFLVAVLLIGIPALMGELTLGRKSQKNVVSTFMVLAPGSKWWFIGVIPLVAVLVILSFYSVIASWAAIYFAGSSMGAFSGLDTQGLTKIYSSIVSNPVLPLMGQLFFLTATSVIVMTGVAHGIERWSKVLMPGLVAILVVLLGRTMLLEGALEGVLWFFRPDFEQFSLDSALAALGQVFFSFSLGMGAILTYGSYLSPKEDIPKSAFFISLSDVGIAMLMGLIVIPALFVFEVQPEIGPGIIFVTLPSVFNALPGDIFWSSLFFLMLTFAALTSSVSMLEVGVAYFVDERGWGRPAAVALLGSLIFLLGIPSALSKGLWSGIIIWGRDILDFVDFISSSILLPLGGLLIIIFLAWVWGAGNAVQEMRTGAAGFGWHKTWSFLVRFVIPPAILYIFISGI